LRTIDHAVTSIQQFTPDLPDLNPIGTLMTCREFFKLNMPDKSGKSIVIEGIHPIHQGPIYLAIVNTELFGWGIETEEDRLIDPLVPDRDLLSEALNWLESNFGDYERNRSVELSALYDDILNRLSTTCSTVDISISELNTAIVNIENERSLEGMNCSLEDWEPEIVSTAETESLVSEVPNSVLIISESGDWQTYLTQEFNHWNFSPLSAENLSEGAVLLDPIPNCAIVLDAKALTTDELRVLRNLKEENPELFLVAIVKLPCPYEEEILYLASDVFVVAASMKGIIRSLQRYFWGLSDN